MEKIKKPSGTYWEKRIAEKTWAQYNSIEERNRKLLEMYQDAARSIADELYTLGQKFSRDGVLSRSEMYKQNRLSGLKSKIMGEIETLGGSAEAFAAENMQSGFKKVYQNTREQLGGVDFSLPNKKAMNEMLDRPWLGGNFSGRLWKNTEKLAWVLNDSLARGIEQGKTTTEMAIDVSNAMQSGFNTAHRLVRTETMHFLNSAALQGYRDSGVKRVQYWAAEDERTCKSCGTDGYHGRIFDIEKVPILPLHPNCRCTYLPVIADDLMSEPDMLKIAGNPPDAIITAFEQEISLIPKKHMRIIESEVKKVVIDRGGNSRYNRKTGVLYLSDDLTQGEIVHELAHALETRLNLFFDEDFTNVLQSGFEDFSWGDLEYVPDEYGKPVSFVKNSKLISEYQGRMYEDAGFWGEDNKMNPFALGEYFTEGYREYIFNPNNLKTHDRQLYDFIEEIER